MIEVVKEFTFDSAHFLPKYEGNCKNVHGHTYRLIIGIKGKINPETGMVVDFKELKDIVKRLVIDELDHKMLNDIKVENEKHPFPADNPTAENMVEWIVDILFDIIPQEKKHESSKTWQWLPQNSVGGLYANKNRLSFVRLYETPTSYAEWRSEWC